MRLVDLDPHWMVDEIGRRLGVSFVCPKGCPDTFWGNGFCGGRVYVPFKQPLDGAPVPASGRGWDRTGETFDTLTLAPSILVPNAHGNAAHRGCGWHGFVEGGVVRTC